MKGIPVWVWLVAAGVGIYAWTRTGSTGVGSQVYIPASTQLYNDAALSSAAGASSIAGIYNVVQQSGNALQVAPSGGGLPYWVGSSAATAATSAQLSASSAGTLT
jgi:hypothetical protein